MDLGKAFGYPMRDENWIVKVLIGMVVSLIPIVNFIGAGYQLRVLDRVRKGDDDSLPEWDDWGGDFMRGIMVFLGSVIYMIPGFILFCCLGFIIGAVGSASDTLALLLNLCVFLPVVIIYSIAVGPMLLHAVLDFLDTQEFGAFLNYGKHFRMVQENMSALISLVIYSIILGFGIGIVVGLTFWLCGLGFFIAFAGQLMTVHLAGQYARQIA